MTENFDNIVEFKSGKTLIIDGDIILYRTCCVHNEDHNSDREQIALKVQSRVNDLLISSQCDDFEFYLTGKYNFRNLIVSDYKFNRRDMPRPINLKWSKAWAVANLGASFIRHLEADDVLGLNMGEGKVLWSIDKDLRQLPGMHLDDATNKVVFIDNFGVLKDQGKKIYFDGMIGFYYQLLVGDNADYIVGCGVRMPHTYKTGPKAGQEYLKRVGVGPKTAYQLLVTALLSHVPNRTVLDSVVTKQYMAQFGKHWKEMIETQGNLLWMVREMEGLWIKRWTIDGRNSWFNVETGEIGEHSPTAA